MAEKKGFKRFMSTRNVKLQSKFVKEIESRTERGELPRNVSRSFIEERLIEKWIAGEIKL